MTNAKLILSNKRQINAEHAKAETLLASALEHARRAGALLLETKQLLPHGSWEPWLDKHFNGTDRTARLYMQVARNWGQIVTIKTEMGISVLGLAQALKLLRESTRETPTETPELLPQTTPEPTTTYPQTGDDPHAPVTTTLPPGGATTISQRDPDAWRADTPAPTPPPKAAPPTVEEATVKEETTEKKPKKASRPKPNPHEEEICELVFLKNALLSFKDLLPNIDNIFLKTKDAHAGAHARERDVSLLEILERTDRLLLDLLRGLRASDDVRLAPPSMEEVEALRQEINSRAKDAITEDEAEHYYLARTRSGWTYGSSDSPRAVKDVRADLRAYVRERRRYITQDIEEAKNGRPTEGIQSRRARFSVADAAEQTRRALDILDGRSAAAGDDAPDRHGDWQTNGPAGPAH